MLSSRPSNELSVVNWLNSLNCLEKISDWEKRNATNVLLIIANYERRVAIRWRYVSLWLKTLRKLSKGLSMVSECCNDIKYHFLFETLVYKLILATRSLKEFTLNKPLTASWVLTSDGSWLLWFDGHFFVCFRLTAEECRFLLFLQNQYNLAISKYETIYIETLNVNKGTIA